MKYVKIYNEKMQCTGVADISQNYDKDGYVKLFDKDMHALGVIDVDEIPESGDNMPLVQVFDENMMPCGTVTADNIRHSDGYLIRLQKDPSTTGTVTGGGRFIAGTSVTVVATPDVQSEYPEFDGWYEGATKVSENASYTFTVSGARTLVAKFKEATPTPIPTSFVYIKTEGTAEMQTLALGVKMSDNSIRYLSNANGSKFIGIQNYVEGDDADMIQTNDVIVSTCEQVTATLIKEFETIGDLVNISYIPYTFQVSSCNIESDEVSASGYIVVDSIQLHWTVRNTIGSSAEPFWLDSVLNVVGVE